jgi:hypothetical protein
MTFKNPRLLFFFKPDGEMSCVTHEGYKDPVESTEDHLKVCPVCAARYAEMKK